MHATSIQFGLGSCRTLWHAAWVQLRLPKQRQAVGVLWAAGQQQQQQQSMHITETAAGRAPLLANDGADAACSISFAHAMCNITVHFTLQKAARCVLCCVGRQPAPVPPPSH